MKKKLTACAIVFLCLGFLCFSQTLGSIAYCEGSVQIVRNGRKINRVAIGFPIENLDHIITARDSLATISFLPDSGISGTLDVSAESSAIIRRNSLIAGPANDVYLIGGSLSLKVKRLGGNNSSVRVRTPSSVLGVRGTEFTAATLGGNTLVACREGDVFCSPYSPAIGTSSSLTKGVSAVPGTMIEILDSGKLKTGVFPSGDFYKEWERISERWKTFHVELITADPVVFIDRFVSSWERSLHSVLRDAAVLRKNETASQWLKTARRDGDIGSMGAWIVEKPVVMKDMLAMRPHLVLATIPWLRLQELVSLVPKEAMNQPLSNGQTVQAFIKRFSRDSQDFSAAMNLFYALEKQYMRRNEGVSPFMDF